MPALSGSKGGQKVWATPDQCEFLKAQIPTFLYLRAEGPRCLYAFWIQLYDSWFERWPQPEESTVSIGPQKLVCVVAQSGPELTVLPIIAPQAVV
jgi:hypothetical protein